MDPRTTIERYLGTLIDATEVELHLLTAGGTSSFVTAFEVPNPLTEELITVAAESVISFCEADVAGAQTPNTYFLCRGAKHPGRSAQFKFQPRQGQALVSEPANQQGLVGQSMRHTEAMTRIMVQSHGNTIDTLTRLLHEKDEECRALARDRLRTIKLVEELHSEAHARQLETRKAESTIEQREQLMAQASTLMPAVLARLSGGGGAGAGPREEAVRALAASMTDEQKQALAGILSPAQLASLVSLAQDDENAPQDDHTH